MNTRTRFGILSAIATCITLWSAAAQAAPPHKTTALQPLGMYDATGKLVGRHFAYPAGVVMNLNGVQTFVSLHGAGNISGFNLPDYDKTDLMELGQLFFATPDCTGPGYVNPELMTAYGMKRGVMVLDGVGRRFVYRITAGRPVLVNAISQYSRGVCSPAGHEMEYFQTEITPVEVTEFAPPFDIR